MYMYLVDVNGDCVRAYVHPRPTATLRMRERCSNSADLAGFRNQLLFVSGPGNVMGAYAWSSNRHK